MKIAFIMQDEEDTCIEEYAIMTDAREDVKKLIEEEKWEELYDKVSKAYGYKIVKTVDHYIVLKSKEAV
jgi:hypothetical protein